MKLPSLLGCVLLQCALLAHAQPTTTPARVLVNMSIVRANAQLNQTQFSASLPQGAQIQAYQDVQVLENSLCPAGFFCPITPMDSTAPTPCPAGTFNPSQGAVSLANCSNCTAGGYCFSGASVVTPCNLGTFRTAMGGRTQADCSPCPTGFFCAPGAATATQCPAGSHCPPNTTAPVVCPPARFCPAGTETQQICTEWGPFSAFKKESFEE